MTRTKKRSSSGAADRAVGECLSWPADVILHPDHSLREARARMRGKNRSFAPVVDGDALVGVLALSWLCDRPEGDGATVHDVMLSTVPFLYDDDPVSLGAAIAARTEIDHFCVVDHDHLLLGIAAFAGDDRIEPPARLAAVDEATVRKRLVVTAGRAAAGEMGSLETYAEGPTLYVDGRGIHEPRDRPDPATRRQRDEAVKPKL